VIITFDKDGEKILEFNPRIRDLEYYVLPYRPCVNSQDDIIVSDAEEKSLKIFDDKGQLMAILANSDSGLVSPNQVSSNHRGEIFLLDGRPNEVINRDIKVFSLDGEMTYTSREDVPEGFNMACGITVNSTNVIVASDGVIEIFADTRYFC
jgi:hypothetical protein